MQDIWIYYFCLNGSKYIIGRAKSVPYLPSVVTNHCNFFTGSFVGVYHKKKNCYSGGVKDLSLLMSRIHIR